MKAVLVVDMPEDYMGSVIDVKLYGKEKVTHEQYVNMLRPLPKPKTREEEIVIDQFIEDLFYDDYIRGWNACLDEIMGEQNEQDE